MHNDMGLVDICNSCDKLLEKNIGSGVISRGRFAMQILVLKNTQIKKQLKTLWSLNSVIMPIYQSDREP